MINTQKSHYFSYAPLYLFLITYTITDLIGALLLLFNNQYVTQLYLHFSGTKLPILTGQQFTTVLCLLLITPLLFSGGYLLSTKGFLRHSPKSTILTISAKKDHYSLIIANSVFYLLCTSAWLTLSKTDCFSLTNTWLSYTDWIFARWLMFQEIGFFAFANIYTFIPLAATWVALIWHPKNWLGHIMRWLPAILAIAINCLIYQKKSILVAELILLISWFTYLHTTNAPKASIKKLIFSGGILLFLTYYLSLSITQLAPTQNTLAQAIAKSPVAEKVIKQLTHSPYSVFFLTAEKKDLSIKSHTKRSKKKSVSSKEQLEFFLNYSLLAPITRTAAPALYYSVVFPAHHAFYGLDVGQDVLGFGQMPDDNIVVWHYMNPHLPGTTTAPFQFILFSQIGLIGTFVFVFLTGVLLGFAWKIITHNFIPQPWASLLSSMILLFAIYLAIDAARVGVLSSFGVLWGALFIFSVWFFTHYLQKFITYCTKSNLNN